MKVYDLADDPEHVRHVQRATLETNDSGLVPRHGLFGSEGWWAAIEDGRIRVHTLEGTITRVYMGSMNDWPEFEIEAGGERSVWTRLGYPASYVVGQRAKIDYVNEEFKRPLPGSRDRTDRVVLRQWLEFD